MPSSFLTLDDILRLPLRRFQTSVGPGLVVERGFRKHRVLDAYRLFASDTWRIGQRLTVNYGLGSERVRLVLFGEVFNLLNTANLVGYSGNIANPAQFGQPGERFNQIFGSGGPRAFQLGMKVGF